MENKSPTFQHKLRPKLLNLTSQKKIVCALNQIHCCIPGFNSIFDINFLLQKKINLKNFHKIYLFFFKINKRKNLLMYALEEIQIKEGTEIFFLFITSMVGILIH